MTRPVRIHTVGAAVAPGATRPTEILCGHGPAREAALEPEYSDAALHRRRPASPTYGAKFVQPPAHTEYPRLSVALALIIPLVVLIILIRKAFPLHLSSAFIIGQMQSWFEFGMSGSMARASILLLVIVLLFFRPNGLFATKVRR